MAACAPQRFLANNRNAVRAAAALTPSAVEAKADAVLELPVPRDGTAQVAITGAYSGAEEATYDVEIVDNTAITQLISTPVFNGEGSGTLENITAPSGSPQTFVVQLNDAGIPTTTAAVDFEGVRIEAAAAGSSGNALRMIVDQTTLVFSDTAYSLLADLNAGAGGETTALTGAAYDWDAAVLGVDNIIPSTAHRVAFGDDEGQVYLSFKQFKTGNWLYRFVPEIQRKIPAGTPVKFVTGGRVVTITDGTGPGPGTEDYPGIATDFDLLDALKTSSALVRVVGVVANDRSPTGQASHELSVRTDARVEPSTGSGGSATGFENTFANPGAVTELITATCYAVTPAQSPLAHLGKERWKVRGSLSGDLGSVYTGEDFTDPTGKFGFRIPVRLPTGSGEVPGRFTVAGFQYMARAAGVENPPICVVAKSLGPNAADQTITLEYTKRPSGVCICSDMTVPNLDTSCLGNVETGSSSMTYKAANKVRLVALYDWFADTVRDNTSQGTGNNDPDQAPFLTKPIVGHKNAPANDNLVWPPNVSSSSTQLFDAFGFPVTSNLYAPQTLRNYTPFESESLQMMVKRFEEALALLDPLPAGADYNDGVAAWDTALTELQADVAAQLGTTSSYTLFGSSVTPATGVSAIADEALTAGNVVIVYKDVGGVVRMRKWIKSFGTATGWVNASVSAAASGTAVFAGVNSSAVHDFTMLAGSQVYPGTSTAGKLSNVPPSPASTVLPQPIFTALSSSSTYADGTTAGLTSSGSGNRFAILADRYKSRLNWVLISGGISPLGKTDADTLKSGDGCWQDYGDAFYWTVVGSDGAYAPAFNNHPYYSSRDAATPGQYFSTHEFAFQVNVKCPGNLLVGDKVTLTIGGAAYQATYQPGDFLTLPIIGALPLYLAGGQNGSAVQTWNVSGSETGPLPNFVYDPDAPAPYSEALLTFEYEPGGIPNVKGDSFKFSVEGGHYRWRKNGGAWSASTAIPSSPVSLELGLSLSFLTGATPSFVADDMFSFRATQPWAVSNLLSPTPDRWQWGASATPSVVIDLGTAQDLDMAAIALHTLPSTAGITLEGGTSAGVYLWSESMTWREGVIATVFAAVRNARYLRLSLTGAAAGGIGWLWAGLGLSTSLRPAMDFGRAWKIDRGNAGLFSSGATLGRTINGTVTWSEAALSEADAAALDAMLDWCKTRNDEPFVFLPNITRPDSVLARVVADEVRFPDIFEYGPNAGYDRRLSTSLQLQGVWQ